MTDETPAPEATTVEHSRIDPAALERWASLPIDANIFLTVTRADLDGLLVGLRQLAFAQGYMMSAIQALSHNDNALANTHWGDAALNHNHAVANLTQFTTGLMLKAQVDE